MEPVQVKWIKEDIGAQYPKLDINKNQFYFYPLRPIRFERNKRQIVYTGLSIELPPEYRLELLPIPHMLCEYGLEIISDPFISDVDPRGQIKLMMCLTNFGMYDFMPTDQIAVGRIVYNPIIEFDLPESELSQEQEEKEEHVKSTLDDLIKRIQEHDNKDDNSDGGAESGSESDPGLVQIEKS